MFLRQIKNEKGLIGKRMLNICLNKLYSGKADVRKVSIFRFQTIRLWSLFGELQLTQIKTSCFNSKSEVCDKSSVRAFLFMFCF